MNFELVNKENLNTAIKIQHNIFPLENGSQDLIESVYNNLPSYVSSKNYWLVKVDDKYVGICGLYAYNNNPKDVWLGWFGVLSSQRGKGYATQIFNFCMNEAKQLGFETLRLYTDEKDNAKAVKFYQKLDMISEVYNNPQDTHFEISQTLIFSKSLTNKPITLWNNKNLFLSEHDKRNNII